MSWARPVGLPEEVVIVVILNVYCCRMVSKPSHSSWVRGIEGVEVRMAKVSRLECADALHGIRVVDDEGGSGKGICSHSACAILKLL